MFFFLKTYQSCEISLEFVKSPTICIICIYWTQEHAREEHQQGPRESSSRFKQMGTLHIHHKSLAVKWPYLFSMYIYVIYINILQHTTRSTSSVPINFFFNYYFLFDIYEKVIRLNLITIQLLLYHILLTNQNEIIESRIEYSSVQAVIVSHNMYGPQQGSGTSYIIHRAMN